MTVGATIYDSATGDLLRTFTGPPDLVPLQASEGEAIYDGLLPLTGCKIDLETGEPIFFEPTSAPSVDHVWDAARHTYVMSAEGLKRRQALGEITMLEGRQSRALREWALSIEGGDHEALKKLRDVDEMIAERRKMLGDDDTKVVAVPPVA